MNLKILSKTYRKRAKKNHLQPKNADDVIQVIKKVVKKDCSCPVLKVKMAASTANFRTISILLILSKIFEIIVLQQIQLNVNFLKMIFYIINTN